MAARKFNGPFEIEEGIPIPNRTGRGGGRPLKYRWHEMKVGSSMFLPGRTSSDIGGYLTTVKLRTGFQFTSRSVEGGVRVWRIA